MQYYAQHIDDEMVEFPREYDLIKRMCNCNCSMSAQRVESIRRDAENKRIWFKAIKQKKILRKRNLKIIDRCDEIK